MSALTVTSPARRAPAHCAHSCQRWAVTSRNECRQPQRTTAATSMTYSAPSLPPIAERNTNTTLHLFIYLSCSPTYSLLKITSRSFRYASPHLWSQFLHSLRQPRLDLPVFTRESSYCFQRILAIAILSVYPFSHGWISQKRCKLELPNFHRRLPENSSFRNRKAFP